MNSILLPTPREFSFPECLHFLNRSPIELLHVTGKLHVEKLIKADGQPVLFSVASASSGQLTISVLNQKLSKKINRTVSEYVEEWFDLKTDLRAFYRHASKDALLKPLIKKYFGYRVVGIPDLFESLSWAIIGQQINLNFAYMLKERFIQQFGEKLVFNKKTYHLFPTTRRIAKLQPVDLLALQFSRQKADYVIGVAKAFEAEIISKKELSTLSFDEAKQKLLSLKGIGNWTANYALMKTFHYRNAFPKEDAGLHQAVRKQLQLKEKPSLKIIEELFKNHSGWEAYTTLYLWRSLSDG